MNKLDHDIMEIVRTHPYTFFGNMISKSEQPSVSFTHEDFKMLVRDKKMCVICK